MAQEANSMDEDNNSKTETQRTEHNNIVVDTAIVSDNESTQKHSQCWFRGIPITVRALPLSERKNATHDEYHEQKLESIKDTAEKLNAIADSIYDALHTHDTLSLANPSEVAVTDSITVTETHLDYHTQSGIPADAVRESDTDFKIDVGAEHGEKTISCTVSETAAVTTANHAIETLLREHSSLIAAVETPQSPAFKPNGTAEPIAVSDTKLAGWQSGKANVIDISDATTATDPKTGCEIVPDGMIQLADCAVEGYLSDRRGHVGNIIAFFNDVPSDKDMALAAEVVDLDIEKKLPTGPEEYITMRDVLITVASVAREMGAVSEMESAPAVGETRFAIREIDDTIHDFVAMSRDGDTIETSRSVTLKHTIDGQWQVGFWWGEGGTETQWNEFEHEVSSGLQQVRYLSVPEAAPFVEARRKMYDDD